MQIQEEKADKTSTESVDEIYVKRVKYKKYGTEKILKENEMIIEVEFENYGVKI